MRNRSRGDWARVGAVLAVASMLTIWSAPESAAAQDEPEACRCVDPDGNEIEDCTCFRTPRFDFVAPRVAIFGDRRARLGVSVDVRDDAEPDARGAVVADVLDGGPADEAGIREGDVITHIDGHALSEPIDGEADMDFDLDASVPAQRLLALARELEPGQSVRVEYLRDGMRQTTTVEAEDLASTWGRGFDVRVPDWDQDAFRERLRGLSDDARVWSFRGRADEPVHGGISVFGGPEGRFLLQGPPGTGLGLVELNPALGAYFGAEEGVLVTDVGRGNGLGLEPGDVVLAIDDRAVSTPDRFRRILASYGEEEAIEFRIMRNGDETTVTGRMRY